MGAKRKGQILKLYSRQNGLCFYCKRKMLLIIPQPHETNNPLMATIEHLDDKYDANRGTFRYEFRRVAACFQCNNERNDRRMAEMPKSLLREMAAGKKASEIFGR